MQLSCTIAEISWPTTRISFGQVLKKKANDKTRKYYSVEKLALEIQNIFFFNFVSCFMDISVATKNTFFNYCCHL
jgi:hypothetical protein